MCPMTLISRHRAEQTTGKDYSLQEAQHAQWVKPLQIEKGGRGNVGAEQNYPPRWRQTPRNKTSVPQSSKFVSQPSTWAWCAHTRQRINKSTAQVCQEKGDKGAARMRLQRPLPHGQTASLRAPIVPGPGQGVRSLRLRASAGGLQGPAPAMFPNVGQ